MFIEIYVILARMKFAILLFDKEEGGCLKGVGRTDLFSSIVLIEKMFSGFLLIGEYQIDFTNLWHKGVIEINFVVIEMGWEDMVSCIFAEDSSVVSIF